MNGTGRLCICRRLRNHRVARGLARVMSIRSFHVCLRAVSLTVTLLAPRRTKLMSRAVSSARRGSGFRPAPGGDPRAGCAARCNAFGYSFNSY